MRVFAGEVCESGCRRRDSTKGRRPGVGKSRHGGNVRVPKKRGAWQRRGKDRWGRSKARTRNAGMRQTRAHVTPLSHGWRGVCVVRERCLEASGVEARRVGVRAGQLENSGVHCGCRFVSSLLVDWFGPSLRSDARVRYSSLAYWQQGYTSWEPPVLQVGDVPTLHARLR